MSTGAVFAGVRAVIYDLDGTLYEDTHHFDYYAERMAAALPADRRPAFRADYAASKAGGHTLRVGRMYDVTRDLVLTVVGGRVLAVHRWDGGLVPEAEWQALYPGPVAVNHTEILNVGDLWWVPAAIAVHYGLGEPGLRQAFLETRAYMSGPDFRIAPIPGLRETLLLLQGRGIRQVLATNSPQPDSEALVRKAGLAGILDRSYFESQKPAGFPRVVAEVCREFAVVPNQILSVGDNYVNELAPARDLGVRTAFIDPHDTGAGLPCDVRVRRMAELLPYLRDIGGPGA